jgi:beta-glucosidase
MKRTGQKMMKVECSHWGRIDVPFGSRVATMLMASLMGIYCVAQSHPDQDAMKRAKHLVSQMTTAEKVSQLHGVSDAKTYRIVPGVPRLGIPALPITNGPAGVGPGGAGVQLKATALPSPIALAATWDVEAALEYGQLAGKETRLLGSDLLEAPDINIVRVPQGGRTFETFGEDPWLTGRLAVADIQGIQSAGVMANVKHFLANNQETQRGSINEIIDDRTLHEIYMPGFKAAVQEGHVASVMCAYPRVNGAFNCENKPLLNDVLRGDWGFTGFVISDFGAVHSTDASIWAGLDLELPSGHYFGAALQQALESGQLPMKLVDQALVRRYTAMIQLGLFSRKHLDRVQNDAVSVLADGAASRRIAEESMVLLKNDGNLLPLNSQALHSVALIGPYAVRAKTGGGGSSFVNPFYTIRPEDGIYSHMQSQKTLLVEDGSDIAAAVAAARRAQVAIVMIGDDEGEDHDHSLSLSDAQNNLVAAIAAVNPKTIVVLKSGSAILMPWLASVAAVLEAWYPGEEDGNAVADVLFGDKDPSGRLPITFPVSAEDTLARSIDQYPGRGGTVHYSEGIAVGYRDYQVREVKPLFPFGFGLSYTKFKYGNFSVKQLESGTELTVSVSFTVTNIGDRSGSDIPQIYVSFPHIDEGDEPPFQLKGFQKVTLNPGESKNIDVVLKKDAFSYWSTKDKNWRTIKGDYRISLGESATDIRSSEVYSMH